MILVFIVLQANGDRLAMWLFEKRSPFVFKENLAVKI
jgi:hypothetical protein